MKIHPDVLATHAQFGGDLESMQRLYDSYDHADEITTLRKELAEARAALEPFADVADFMDSETDGFSMDDELWLGINNDEFPPYHIKRFSLQLFYTARACRRAADGEAKP